MVYPDPKFLIFKKNGLIFLLLRLDEEKLCQNKAILGKFLRFNLTDVVGGLKKILFSLFVCLKPGTFGQ